MLILLGVIIVLGVIFWTLCELISAFAGMIFMGIALLILLKLGKDLIS